MRMILMKMKMTLLAWMIVGGNVDWSWILLVTGWFFKTHMHHFEGNVHPFHGHVSPKKSGDERIPDPINVHKTKLICISWHTLSPIIMEVENYPKWKEPNIGDTPIFHGSPWSYENIRNLQLHFQKNPFIWHFLMLQFKPRTFSPYFRIFLRYLLFLEDHKKKAQKRVPLTWETVETFKKNVAFTIPQKTVHMLPQNNFQAHLSFFAWKKPCTFFFCGVKSLGVMRCLLPRFFSSSYRNLGGPPETETSIWRWFVSEKKKLSEQWKKGGLLVV